MSAQLSRRAFLGSLAASAVVAGSGLGLPGLARAGFGPPPGVVRLSANENPYGPSPKALKAIAEAASKGAYYPGAVRAELQGMIAAANGIDTDGVVLSSGSGEALCAATVAWAKQGRIIAPELTFGAHLNYAERLGARIQRVPLKADMDTDLAAMEAAIDDDVSMVYVCNPNNPTGIAIDPDALRAFCKRVGPRATVLIDEAYNELAADPARNSMMDLVRGGENVIVMRTFSKIFGLAGLRIGYSMSKPEFAEVIGRHTMSWPNVAGFAAAVATYDDDAFLAFSKGKVAEGREMVMDLYDRLEIPYLPTETNFVYADIGRDADAFQAAMKARNVHIRGIYAPYSTFSRVSMGKIEDLETFARVFEEVYTA
ncbi:MAG TPA: aminotransferase class I/II-fold pyridoxal phosphate-dependent enzyme [Pseudomonadales bacterium]|nr:aminotransferase class I/II-fold pyridoxal phosphate-dependent enzyme [Pseudomonadales bacterium]